MSVQDKALWEAAPKGPSLAHLRRRVAAHTAFWAQGWDGGGKSLQTGREKILDWWHTEILLCPMTHSALSPLQHVTLALFTVVASKRRTDIVKNIELIKWGTADLLLLYNFLDISFFQNMGGRFLPYSAGLLNTSSLSSCPMSNVSSILHGPYLKKF